MRRLDCSGGLRLLGQKWLWVSTLSVGLALKLSFWDKIGGTILIGECRKHKRNFNGYGLFTLVLEKHSPIIIFSRKIDLSYATAGNSRLVTSPRYRNTLQARLPNPLRKRLAKLYKAVLQGLLTSRSPIVQSTVAVAVIESTTIRIQHSAGSQRRGPNHNWYCDQLAPSYLPTEHSRLKNNAQTEFLKFSP